ncbi:MAG: prepilin-type N-terminal cleavage/methylation domain-containing protein [bacterium]
MRFLKRQAGFSLIELIVVIVIVGILSAIVAVNFNQSNASLQYGALVQKLKIDIGYAQQLAATEGKGTRVYIDQSNNRYYLKWDDGSYIQQPVGEDDFIVQLGTGDFSEVQITGTDFSSGRLDFNTSGMPLNAGNTFTGQLTVVTLNSAKRIKISANTGFLEIEDL